MRSQTVEPSVHGVLLVNSNRSLLLRVNIRRYACQESFFSLARRAARWARSMRTTVSSSPRRARRGLVVVAMMVTSFQLLGCRGGLGFGISLTCNVARR